MRFDDTNPIKEEQQFIDTIQRDVRWLGFDWGEHLYYASDYFEQLYEWAEHLIRTGKAYVDDTAARRDALAARHADRTRPEQSLTATARWRRTSTCSAACAPGEFPNGARVLRAKIDMTSGNMNLRDPVLYRILHATHPRTGDAWCDLSDLRLRARPVGRDRARHALASARWSSRIIGRCTTG